MRLEGKVAIVTGGGQGIGSAIAIALANEGSNIAIFDINMEKAHNIVEEIKSLGRKAVAINCDVAITDNVANAVKNVLGEFNKIDILVNVAGVILISPPENMSEDYWDRMIDTNLKGTFFCCQTVAREMIKQKSGKIINIASLSGLFGGPNRAGYCASKGGVVNLTRALAIDWAKYNINVNSITPGFTETPRTSEIQKEYPEATESRRKRIPLQRAGKPEDVAAVVVFLACSESDYITGIDISVDGGISAIHPGYA
ncbi:SDR family NAD(P)-dependent oxidoreductase [Chloroflexota bacterium]